MHTDLCIADLLFLRTTAQARDRKTVHLMKNRVTPFRQAFTRSATLQNFKNNFYVKQASFNNARFG